MSKTPKEKKPASGDKPAAEAAFSPPAAEAAKIDEAAKIEIVEYKRQQKERINLAELDGSTIVIIDYQLTTSPKFNAQMAVIRFFTPPEGREQEAYTFSRVIIRQLTDEIDPLLRQGKAVKARVMKTKRYLMLAPPR